MTSLLQMTETASLPSTYDKSLPAGMRGEAVRSALKSSRGACINFTPISTKYNNIHNVGVVKVTGKASKPTAVVDFLNNKLCNSFSNNFGSGSSGVEDEDMEEYEVGKQTIQLQRQSGKVTRAGILTSKGRMIDNLSVATFAPTQSSSKNKNVEAYMMTSPGHYGSSLFDRLDPFIFPLDGVKLKDMVVDSGSSSDSGGDGMRVFTFAGTQLVTAQNIIHTSVLPNLASWGLDSGKFVFPPDGSDECIRYALSKSNGEELELVIMEQVQLPKCIVRGYTIMMRSTSTGTKVNGDDASNKVWDYCIGNSGDGNMNGPVELGPLEYETLRIEGGVPAYGYEMTGSFKDKNSDSSDKKDTKAGPLELHLDEIVDESKGCYQGQEGVAAIINNRKKRELPQLLYSVIFPEEDNFYEDSQEDEEVYTNHDAPGRVQNETKMPRVGDVIYALGSGEKIKVGVLTSVAERGGSSLPETVGIVLVRRSAGILKKMKDMDLEFERNEFMNGGESDFSMASNTAEMGSGIIYPPPLDPLDGLDVVIGGGFTRGYLRVVPKRRSALKNKNKFEVESWSMSDEDVGGAGATMQFLDNETEEKLIGRSSEKPKDEIKVGPPTSTSPDKVDTTASDDAPVRSENNDSDNDNALEDKDLKAAIEAAETAAVEARRKEEKLEMLKKRAEAAIETRRKAKDDNKRRQEEEEAAEAQRLKEEEENSINDGGPSTAEIEAKRKADKIEMLRKRAEEAMARRKKKQ